MSFKVVFSILSSDSHFVQPSRTILAILVKGHPRKISVKQAMDLGGNVVQSFFLFLALTAILFIQAKPF